MFPRQSAESLNTVQCAHTGHGVDVWLRSGGLPDSSLQGGQKRKRQRKGRQLRSQGASRQRSLMCVLGVQSEETETGELP